MKSLIIALTSLLLLGGLSACSDKPREQPQPKVTTKYHIRIAANGDIFEGDKQLTAEDLAAKLKELKANGGGIVYTRDTAGESNEAEAAAIRVITESEVPVIYETKK